MIFNKKGKIIIVICLIALAVISSGWLAYDYIVTERGIEDNNGSNINNTNGNQNNTNGNQNNTSFDIQFESLNVIGYQSNIRLNKSVQDHDLALYLSDWDIINQTFDEFYFYDFFDFENYSYVFTFWQQVWSSGYEVNITRLHYDNGTLSVFVDETPPIDGMALLWSGHEPIDIVRIPKNEVTELVVSQVLYVVNSG